MSNMKCGFLFHNENVTLIYSWRWRKYILSNVLMKRKENKERRKLMDEFSFVIIFRAFLNSKCPLLF